MLCGETVSINHQVKLCYSFCFLSHLNFFPMDGRGLSSRFFARCCVDRVLPLKGAYIDPDIIVLSLCFKRLEHIYIDDSPTFYHHTNQSINKSSWQTQHPSLLVRRRIKSLSNSMPTKSMPPPSRQLYMCKFVPVPSSCLE